MINILVPLAGKSKFYKDSPFPKPLMEISGKPMIQRVLERFEHIQQEKRFIFIVNENDCKLFHIDNTLKLLMKDECKIVIQKGKSQGAICSCLLAVDYIDNDEPLLISNSDQVLEIDWNDALSLFAKNKVDAGTVVFKSVHPQWSYVSLDENGYVSSAAEKNPISNTAIAGIYYYSKGSDFIQASQTCIMKDRTYNDVFFLSQTFNELVLAQKKILPYNIEAKKYHSFYSIERIKLFEDYLREKAVA